jgi:hypothetical protein
VLDGKGLAKAQDDLAPQVGAGSLRYISAKDDIVIIEPDKLSVHERRQE